MLINLGQYFSSAGQALKGLVGWGVDPKAELRKQIFLKGPFLPKVETHVSGVASGATFVLSDATSIYRATVDLAQSIWTHFPSSPLNSLHGLFSQADAKIVYQAFGMGTGFNAVAGALGIKQALESAALHSAIGDKKGALIQRLNLATAAAQTGAGVSFIAFRSLSISNAVRPSGLVGRVNIGVVSGGLGLFALFFAFISAALGVQLYEGHSLKSKLEKATTLEEKVALLQKKFKANPDLVYDKLVKKHGPEKARRILIDEALASGKDGLKDLMTELGIKNVSEQQLGELVHKLIESGCNGWTQARRRSQVEEQLMTVGLQMQVQKVQQKNEKKLGRILNKAGMDSIKELASSAQLVGRIQKGDKNAIQNSAKLVEVIKTSLNRKLTENAIMMAIVVLSAVAMVAAIVCTAGVPLIVCSAAMLIVMLLALGVDGYYLIQSYKEERAAPYDKKWMILTAAVGIASFLTVMLLAATGVMTLGTVPLVIAVIMFCIWMGSTTATWMVLERNQKLFKEKNPTLEGLLEALNNKEERTHVMNMYGNLVEPLKVQIEAEMKKHGNLNLGSLKVSTLAVMQKVEKAKKERLELLRGALTPYLVR